MQKNITGESSKKAKNAWVQELSKLGYTIEIIEITSINRIEFRLVEKISKLDKKRKFLGFIDLVSKYCRVTSKKAINA